VTPTWSRDSRRIYFAYDDQGTTRVAETDLTGHVSNLIDDLGGEGWSRPYGGACGVFLGAVCAIGARSGSSSASPTL
jgi:hypothetical protein